MGRKRSSHDLADLAPLVDTDNRPWSPGVCGGGGAGGGPEGVNGGKRDICNIVLSNNKDF